MLTHISIRNIVLIEKLDLDFGPGLWVLTGETGAGKSILLDALGLAVGSRADKALLRQSAEEGSAAAVFQIAPDHAAWSYLDSLDLAHDRSEPLILRRTLKSDGRSKAYLNDRPISISTLSEIGSMLLEIHGQHAEREMLEPASHRDYLDLFAGNSARVHETRTAYDALRAACEALEALRHRVREIETDREFYHHAVNELQRLDVQPREEQDLAQTRTDMMNAEKVVEDLNALEKIISGNDGAVQRVAAAYRAMVRVEQKAPSLLQPVIEALDKASADLQEVEEALTVAQRSASFDPVRLEQIEERLFALRGAARKYKAQVEDLPGVLQQFEKNLHSLDNLDEEHAALEQSIRKTRVRFEESAKRLSAARKKAAKELDSALKSELQPLKLDKARIRTRIDTVDLDQANANGIDRIRFEIATNPGAAFGSLTQIASGGEFARFVLALKAVVAQKQTKAIVVFDEVDQGVSGAVAEAVGERLGRLSAQAQVLVITHSPQVAACGHHHLRISKSESNSPTGKGGRVRTTVEVLTEAKRLEEVARMLSGARITQEARAAAARLLHETAPKKLKTGTSG